VPGAIVAWAWLLRAETHRLALLDWHSKEQPSYLGSGVLPNCGILVDPPADFAGGGLSMGGID
jgi:hypothetical protein